MVRSTYSKVTSEATFRLYQKSKATFRLYQKSKSTFLPPRYPGYWIRDRYVPLERGGGRVGRLRFYYVKEMEPEIIVPDDLDVCKLRPYVTYKSSVEREEFTARSLYDSVYRERIQSLLSDPDMSEEEKRETMNEFMQVNEESIHEARIRARQTGSDLFVRRGWCGLGRERDDNWN